MKRSMGGGALRGPVAHGRQRRTIRLMQILLAGIGLSLLVWAGSVVASGESVAQALVLAAMAATALVVASLLGGRSGVRLPTPARLDELVGRAEAVAIERAEAQGDPEVSAGG